MPSNDLKNKPLVEAILEVKWQLKTIAQDVNIDPHYKLFPGRLYDKLSNEYPNYEQLPTASLPDEIVGYVVQHRFRSASNDWPLVQIGPGILTINDTKNYSWVDFNRRCINTVDKLFDVYPKNELKIIYLQLRYIDAISLDYTKENIFHFLKEKMKVITELPESLFENNNIEKTISHFNWQSAFNTKQPLGTVRIGFATGQKEGEPCLITEIAVQSTENNMVSMPDKFEEWLRTAHDITHDWFFKLIEGELERRFKGEE